METVFKTLQICSQDYQQFFQKVCLSGAISGIFIVNPENNIIYWSKAMENISNLPANKIINSHCPEPLLTDDNTLAQSVTYGSDPYDTQHYLVSSQDLTNAQGEFVARVVFLEAIQQQQSKTEESAPIKSQLNFHGMISRSPMMDPMFQLIENAAATDVTVLVRGESGSGKELVAKAIHDLGSRKQGPFLAINCAALSSNLLESELFGHVKGAFTGAIKDRTGLFQKADHGTLFLDEVAELPLELQAKLLRVLQERNLIPVGGEQSIQVDVRIVAATHRSLRKQVKEGLFREDLMYRLRVVPIFIPPLRERREDIHLLLWHFIKRHNQANSRVIDQIEPEAMKVLIDHHWPGNIRELQNVIEYAFVVGSGQQLKIQDLPPEFREIIVKKEEKTKPVISHVNEAEMIQQALEQHQGRITAAANSLGMSRATFWRKRKTYNI